MKRALPKNRKTRSPFSVFSLRKSQAMDLIRNYETTLEQLEAQEKRDLKAEQAVRRTLRNLRIAFANTNWEKRK